MNENELGKALLQFEIGRPLPQNDPAELTRRVLRRDRRRLKWMTIVTVLLWLAAVFAVAMILWVYAYMVYPKFQQILRDLGQRPIPAADRGKLTPETIQGIQATLTHVVGIGVVAVAITVGILALAAICTVAMVFISSRSTLRQVNANLLVISDQLKRMSPAGG
jgi:hypothetical protein